MKTLGQFSKLAFCALLASSCLQAEAQVDLVRGGKTKSVIILQDDTRENRTAANILQLFVGRISGADIPVVANRKVKKGDILIGGQHSCRSERRRLCFVYCRWYLKNIR